MKPLLPALVLFAAMGMAIAVPATASSFHANDISAETYGGGFTCSGGEAFLFEGRGFAVTPIGDTNSYIDSRTGSALVGGRASEWIAALRRDSDVCAGPIDCADREAIAEAIRQCW